ncbi:MAG: FAD:protein FMN transferase [Pseudomonadota bacterium]
MGSRCELQLYLPASKQSEAIFRELIGEVNRLEEKYSRYKQTSVISAINAAAGRGAPTIIDAETAQLFDYADALYVQSDGMFDITSGVLRQAWDFRSGQLPSDAAIDDTLPLIGWRKVARGPDHIYLPRAGMQVDFGGFAKEYAVDVVTTRCLDLGVEHGIVNLGGDVRVVGPHPDGSPWRVGIQHPRSSDETIAVVELDQGAVATSGDYERFMVVDGKRYCHLLDPRTGRSLQSSLASVSVLANNCLVAGSFSTLAMLQSEAADEWLLSSGLPHLTVDQSLSVNGTIGRTSTAAA